MCFSKVTVSDEHKEMLLHREELCHDSGFVLPSLLPDDEWFIEDPQDGCTACSGRCDFYGDKDKRCVYDPMISCDIDRAAVRVFQRKVVNDLRYDLPIGVYVDLLYEGLWWENGGAALLNEMLNEEDVQYNGVSGSDCLILIERAIKIPDWTRVVCLPKGRPWLVSPLAFAEYVPQATLNRAESLYQLYQLVTMFRGDEIEWTHWHLPTFGRKKPDANHHIRFTVMSWSETYLLVRDKHRKYSLIPRDRFWYQAYRQKIEERKLHVRSGES